MSVKSGRCRSRLKSLAGRAIYRSGLYRFGWRDRAAILLFHRVDDALADNPISCSSDSFDEFCGFLARYFNVIPLRDLVSRLEREESISGCVVITFDDGYKDNLDVAAPILARHGLPACFFVTTDYIGTSKVGPWDEQRGVRSRWMDWDDLRRLRDMGFEIGAHTRTHPDLGKLVGPEARSEISGSRERLKEELHEDVPGFSYPFGGREHFAAPNRTLVQAVGFKWCCSAYGGAVLQDTDPFDLPRVPVSLWYSTPYHLGFELLRE